jgi:long-chain acyl-CoA synthetase
MIRHDSLAFNAQAMGAWGGVNSTSRVLGIAPLFHITGFVSHLAMCIVAQCTLILHYRFEPRVVLDVIRKTRPTYVVGAITAFNALMNTEGACKEDFESFDAVYSGGAAIAPALANKIEARLGVSIRPCYGMTETTSPSHATPPRLPIPIDPDSGAMAVGIPIFSTEAMIVSESGEAVPVGERGELWMRGPQIMTGYWNKPEETSEALSDGWMRSGDIAFMDTAGWFYLVDRKKDMINASGFKVWPREVEDCLYQHAAIREAAVVGIPDPYRGENVVAYISLRSGAATTREDLTAFCRERLTGYKCPRRFEILDELPKTITGKIQRNVVREMARRLTTQ